MIENVGILLKDILLKTFFDFAMFEILPLSGKPDHEPEMSETYSITTQSPEKYRLNFSFSDEIQKKIVENIFEKPIKEISKEQINDCILEIVNIVSGNFFTAFFKEDTMFEMGLPHIYKDLKTKKEIICSIYFSIDEKLFKVELI